MWLCISWNGDATVKTVEQEVIDFLAADPANSAYGFIGWKVELVDDEEEVTSEPAQPEE